MAAWRETTSALAHCQIVRGRWCLSLSPTRCRLVAPIYPLPLLMTTTTMRFVAMPPCRTPGDSISLGRHTESIRATIVCTPINWLCAANSHLRWPSPWPLPLRCSFFAISVRLNRWPHQRERRRIRSTMTVGWLLFCLNFSHFFCLIVCSLLSANIFNIRVFFFYSVCWVLSCLLAT